MDSPTAITLLTVKDLARILNVSTRTVWSWRDAHRMPLPMTIGGVCRWRSDEIHDWITSGCPDLRKGRAAR